MKLKFDPYLFEEGSAQGIPLYVKHIPWANGFVYIRVQIAVGARQDPAGKEGLSHFFEHLPFNGCAGWPTFEEIEKISRTLFLDTLNASTYFDRTVFSGKVSSARLAEALDFLGKFIYMPRLEAEEIERERKVITQEIWRRYNSERQEELSRTLRKLEYGAHPFARQESPIGWHDTVAGISRQDLLDFHRTHYHAGTTRVIMAGDIDLPQAAETMEAFTASCPAGERPPRPEAVQSWPLPAQPEFEISASEYFGLSGSTVPRKTHISIMRNLPVSKNEQLQFIAFNLIRQILFERIRGKLGAVYSPFVGGALYIDHHSAEISLEVAPEAVPAIRGIILETLGELGRADSRHATLFDEVKQVFLDFKLFYDPAICDIADGAASELATKDHIDSAADECAKIERVTYADIARFISEHFSPEKLFWAIVRP